MAESYVEVTEGSGKKLWTETTVVGADTKHAEIIKLGEQYLSSYIINTGSISTATAIDALQIMAGASLRVRIRRITIQQTVLASAASTLNLALFRLTSAGTGGGAILTNTALDPSDSAPELTAMTLPSAAGTKGARLMEMMFPLVAAHPMSASQWQWIQSPTQKPIIIPAGTSNGLGFNIRAGIAGASITLTVEYDESSF
jgi:hypothetical protein